MSNAFKANNFAKINVSISVCSLSIYVLLIMGAKLEIIFKLRKNKLIFYKNCNMKDQFCGNKVFKIKGEHLITTRLEWVANGEMYALRILKVVEIVEAMLVRQVQTYAPIKTQDEEIEVVAYAHTRTESHFAKHIARFERCSCAVVALAQRPNVACIEEECAIKTAKETRTILEVGLELNIASLVEVGNIGTVGVVSARSDATHIESTYAVSTTHIELLAIRRTLGVAISPNNTSIDVPNERVILTNAPCLGEIGLHFDELSVRIPKQTLLFLCPFLPESHISKRENIGRFAERQLPEDRVMICGRRLLCKGVAHLWHELVAHSHLQIRASTEHIAESVSHVLHIFKLQDEWRELMLHRGFGMQGVSEFG